MVQPDSSGSKKVAGKATWKCVPVTLYLNVVPSTHSNNSQIGSPSMVMLTTTLASSKWAGKGEASHTPRRTLRRWQTSTVHATALCAQLRHATACYGALSALAPGGRCNACYCACYGTLSALARVAHHHEKHHHLRFYVISGIVLIPLVRWTKIRTACQPQSSCRAADGTSLSNAQNTYASNKDCVSAAPQLMALASRFLILTQVGQGKLDNIDFFRFCCSPRVFCFVVQYGICSLFGFRKNHKTA